ncbi:hypothetical protein L195_g048601 [Trifolium pratense]|uniref:Uncharacterized protein n=1 Tax=Trifolium pratense TaxID=57577 RepID=A0A2K3JLS0_TRIPR|nr:hypothetical protein L195_g048601 [Trifolium pratense]
MAIAPWADSVTSILSRRAAVAASIDNRGEKLGYDGLNGSKTIHLMTTWKTFEKTLIQKFQPVLWARLRDSEDEKQDYVCHNEVQREKPGKQRHQPGGAVLEWIGRHMAKRNNIQKMVCKLGHLE